MSAASPASSQSPRLPPLSALRVFEAAARLSSFKRAAAELHVTPAAVSQQIRSLESFLGVALFHRESRGLVLSVRGKALYPGVREGFAQFARAVERSLASGQDALTVTAPPSFATRWLVPRLSGWAREHPDIALRVSSEAANIDAEPTPPAAAPPHLDRRDDTATIAIRFGRGRYPGCRDRKILAPAYLLVCSPSLLSGAAAGRDDIDLRRQVLLHDESVAVEQDRPDWAAWLGLAGIGDVDATRGPRFSNSIMTLEAAVDGQGVALLLEPLVEAELASGRLRAPYDIRLPSAYAYYLSVPEALVERPVVLAFEQWLMAQCGLAAAVASAPGDRQ